MKKLFTFILFAFFAFFVSASLFYEIKGDRKEAQLYEVAALGTLMIPAINQMRLTTSLGLGQMFYAEATPRLYSRAHKYLLDYLNGMLPGTKPKQGLLQDLKDGKLKILPYQQSLRFIITPASAGRMKLLDNVTAASQGRIPSEFDKGQLPEGSVIAFDYLRLGWASDTTADVPEEDVDFANIVDSWPPALRNADLMWTQMSDLKFRLSATAFGVKAASNESAVKSDGYNFNEPVIIEEKKQNTIELYCPDGVVMPSALNTNYFLEITIDGAALIATR